MVTKKQHEKAVANDLIKTLQINNLNLDHLGDDNTEPDIIYKARNKKIGIEVCTAYLGDGYAQILWETARGSKNHLGVIHNTTRPSERICESIKKCLQDKINKNYTNVDEVWLCIEIQNPFSSDGDITNCLEQIAVSKNNFAHIYLLHRSSCHEDGNFKVFNLK